MNRSGVVRHSAREEANIHVSRRTGVGIVELAAAAWLLWGHSFSDERDKRADEAAGPNATPRRLQAVRGAISKKMTREVLVAGAGWGLGGFHGGITIADEDSGD